MRIVLSLLFFCLIMTTNSYAACINWRLGKTCEDLSYEQCKKQPGCTAWGGGRSGQSGCGGVTSFNCDVVTSISTCQEIMHLLRGFGKHNYMVVECVQTYLATAYHAMVVSQTKQLL